MQPPPSSGTIDRTRRSRWQQDMLTIRLALYRRSGLLRPNVISGHAWDRNEAPERSHVSMGEVLFALQHRDARIIGEHTSPKGPVRVVKGYTWDGTCLHVVVGIRRHRPPRIRIVTYWDPAMAVVKTLKLRDHYRLRRPLPRPVNAAAGAAAGTVGSASARLPAEHAPEPPTHLAEVAAALMPASSLVHRSIHSLWAVLYRLASRPHLFSARLPRLQGLTGRRGRNQREPPR